MAFLVLMTEVIDIAILIMTLVEIGNLVIYQSDQQYKKIFIQLPHQVDASYYHQMDIAGD